MSIWVVGTGIHAADHVTRETEQALRGCDIVFHLVVGWPLLDYLASVCRNVVSLVPLYAEGRLDSDVYEEIADTVVAAASTHANVGLVVIGHPRLYVAPTELIERRGKTAGIAVHVLAGISSVDTMLLDFAIDIGRTGLQILDANRVISYGLQPDPRLPLMLFQIGAFGSGYITRTRTSPEERFKPLQEWLLQFYPARHEVHVHASAMGPLVPGVDHKVPVGLLASAAAYITYNSTLFVPPARPLQVENPEWVRQLTDPSYVEGLAFGR